MAERRIYKPEEKLKIVLEGMNGTVSVADLCRKYDIKPARFYYWKDQLVNSAREIFEDRGRKPDIDSRIMEKERENARLKEVIAEITQENLEIKKKLGERLKRRGST
jgi:transposase-like protein